MGILSLNWFKSEKQKELEALLVEGQKMQNQILKEEIEATSRINTPITPKESRPYLKVKLINHVLTIVLLDGNIISKPNATQEDFQKARNTTFEHELFTIVSCPEGLQEMKKKEAEAIKVKALLKGIESLEELEDFEVREGSVYLKGVERSMPQVLVEKFIEIVAQETLGDTDDYEALKKFWLKCCLNPNAQSAEDLYKFLARHQFKIDKHGNFYAYRRVVSAIGADKTFVDFVSNAYNKVKAVWKKKPADFYVWEDDKGTFAFTKNSKDADGIHTYHGTLEDLYKDLPALQEKMFTSKHTGQEDYRVGEVISMPRNVGDDNNQVSCSKGFHAASKAYDYSSFGDTPILVIINPIDVLAVPLNEDGKLRTCRWFFAMTLTKSEEHILDDPDFDTTDLGDTFEEKCMQDLQTYVQNSFAEEVQRHTFTIPQISAYEITNIVASLEEMRGAISDRVVEID